MGEMVREWRPFRNSELRGFFVSENGARTILRQTVNPIVLLCIVCGWLSLGVASELPTMTKENLSILANRSRPDGGLLKQIAGVYPKLRKHLYLGPVRGANEVSLYRENAPAVVLVVTEEGGSGSGTIIDDAAHVLTNWHVVAGYSEVYVAFMPQKGEDLKKELVRLATVEHIDKDADLALLKIVSPITPFSTIKLGDSSALEIGQDVFAIGHPRGEFWSFTKGIISQIRTNYKWTVSNSSYHATIIQTQTPINPGNSGGPLLNDQGQLIGVNTFIRPDSRGLNYAVAVDTVQHFLQQPPSPPQRSPSTNTTQQTQDHCPDRYDSLGRGWNNIGGCYEQKGTAPPPDYWIVKHDPEGKQSYVVIGRTEKTQLDMVFQASSTVPGEIDWYVDSDCDGMVDVLGYQAVGSDKIERYGYPPEPYPISSQAKELHQALMNYQIPLSSVQFCQ